MNLNLINGIEQAPCVNGLPGAMDVVQAIRAANAASGEWTKVGAAARADLARAWVDRVEAAGEGVARAEAESSGVTPDLARRDLELALRDARAAIDVAAEFNRPLGVVGVITARALVTRTILPRVAALLVGGNAVILKPSSRAPAVVGALLGAFAAAGLPPGVVNVVFGPGETLGSFLTEHPGVPAVAFYGRTVTGRSVATAAGAHLKRASLALGAKNAAIVLKDADLDDVVPRLLRAAFARGGVDPFALSKILVAREIAGELLTRLRAAAPGRLTLPTDHDAAEFARYVALAKSEDGRVTGGAIDGRSVEPAIVGELTHCSEIHQDELLVPLLTVNEIKYAHEGVKWANTSPYGRAAGVFTANHDLARKLAGQLDVGTVWINGWCDDAAATERGADQKASSFGAGDLPTFGQRPPSVIA